MRLYSLLCLLSCLVLALAWTKEDHEIFDLVSALEAAEGKGVNFYSHLGVEPSASLADIAKAYRKRSLELHPDKNPGVKGIEDRFARLGVINQILRSPEGRERYNFFYKNGVPKWRGTGYYYSRYRPTLSHTLLFLVLLTAGAHRLVMQLNYNRDRQRIRYFERAARISAGSKSPATGEKDQAAAAKTARRRKVKVPMVEGRDNTGYLDLIVVGDEVFLPNEDGTESPLSSLTNPPSFFRTWPITLSLSIARRAVSFLPPSAQASLPSQLRPAAADDGSDAYAESDSEGEAIGGPDTPTPAGKPDRNKASRAMALQRSQGRANGGGKKGASGTADSQATTEVEDTEDDGANGAGEEKKRRSAGGKANAARRRKMGLKK